MDVQTPEQIMRQFFDLIVDANRLRITGRLIERPWTVSDLASELHLKPQAVLTHLGRLDEAGLVIVDEAGGRRSYRFNVPALHALNKQVRESEPHLSAPKLENADAGDQKILADFFNGPLLKTIPAQRGKRLVVCARFARQFTPGTDYPERDVNEILARHHPDFASLRRQLVDEGFLTRDHGVYRRVTESTSR